MKLSFAFLAYSCFIDSSLSLLTVPTISLQKCNTIIKTPEKCGYLLSTPDETNSNEEIIPNELSEDITSNELSEGIKSYELSEKARVLVGQDGGSPCSIKVIGIGGGGGNAVNRMIESDTQGVDYWAVNTDVQALSKSLAQPQTLAIGEMVTKGLGAGGDPMVGRKAADESARQVEEVIKDADLVFVTAGMGGGTGSGAAPIVAEISKSTGALTVAVVTKPFGFEGRRRAMQASEAIKALQDSVDTLIVISNDKLLDIVPENTPVQEAFLYADDILRQGVIGISEIIIKPGLVNVDFADVRAVMQNAGSGIMGVGTGKGKDRAKDAAVGAISSPLLDAPLTKAKGVVFNIIGDKDLTLNEINEAAEVIYESVDPEANIIFGALVDENLEPGTMTITVLATGVKTAAGSSATARRINPAKRIRTAPAASQAPAPASSLASDGVVKQPIRQKVNLNQDTDQPFTAQSQRQLVQPKRRKSKRKMFLNLVRRILGLSIEEQ